MPNTLPGISRFPYGVTSSQKRIESLLQESIRRSSTVEIKWNVFPIDLVFDPTRVGDDDCHPITVKFGYLEKFDPASTGPSQSEKLKYDAAYGHDLSNNNRYFSSYSSREHQTADHILHCKYMLGCDGAHSWVRKHLGISMEGDQTNHIWGVLGKFFASPCHQPLSLNSSNVSISDK